MLTATAVGPRRGRPRNVERRRAIAREAIGLFAAHGYDGCTLQSVADSCGMGKTLLARYFARKELLLAASVDYAHERAAGVVDALKAAASRAIGLREFLLVAGTIYMQHVHELGAWYVLWLGGLPLTTEQRERFRATEESLYGVVAAFSSAKGSVRDPYVFARSFLGALQSLVLVEDRMGFESSAELRRIFLEELVALLWRGCSPEVSR